MQKRNIIFSVCLILIVTFISYHSSIKNDFVNWDDNLYITGTNKIRELSLKSIVNFFTSYDIVLYNPLVSLSFAIEYKFFKLNPHAYHLTNLILHLINCLLVFWLIVLLSKKASVSFIVALLFGIHPLHVESVAWISERKDVLYALFYLGSIISYIYYLKGETLHFIQGDSKKQNDGGKKYYYYSIFLFLLSLLSKSMAVTLPFVLILTDYLNNKKINKNTLKEKIPFFILSIVFGIITVFGNQSLKNANESQVFVFSKSILNVSDQITFYIIKTIIPVKLSCIYPYLNKIGNLRFFDRIGSEFSGIFLFSPIILIFLTVLIFISVKYTKKIIFGSLIFLITLLPVINIIPIGWNIPADRYTYIPLLGIFYIIGEIFSYFYTKYNKIIKILLCSILIAIIIVFSYLTQQRCQVWKDSITLWNDVIKNYPNSIAIAHYDRGKVYQERGVYNKALSDYEQAIKIDPNCYEAYYNRGITYQTISKYDEALLDYDQAIKINPNYKQAFNNRGVVYYNKKDYKKAFFDYNQAIKIDKNYSEAYNNRGTVYQAIRNYIRALSDYEQAIRIDKYYVEAYNNRGNIYQINKEYDRAISDYEQAVKINPNYLNAYNNLAVIYYNKKEYARTVLNYSRIIAISQDNVQAYYNRAIAYYQNKEYDRAVKDIIKLQELGYKIPDDFEKILERYGKLR